MLLDLSFKQIVEIKCPRCGTQGEAEVWSIVDAQANPEAKIKILRAKINLFRCGNCGYPMSIPAYLLYHDVENGFCVQYFPRHAVEDNRFLDRFTDNAELDLDLGLPVERIPDYFKNVHFVFTAEELRKYIIFREILAKRKASIRRGRLACFSCGRSINDGENCFCISRRRQIKSDADEGGDQIIEAVASLQVCADCVAKASTQPMVFRAPPLPLLKLETNGFNRFATWLAGCTSCWEPMVEGRDSCSLCGAPVEGGDRYTRIELTREVHDVGRVSVKEAYALATICENCADKYLVWL